MSRDTGKTHPVPAAVPERRLDPPAGRRRTLALSLVALLLGVALLGGLAWTLGRDTPNQKAPNEAVAERVEVPGVVGLPQEEAQKRLAGEGLELGSRDEASSAAVAEGAVIEQDPAPGTRVTQGRAVNVVISTGPPQEPRSSSATATATATATASPAAGGAEAAEEAAKEREKRREEAQKRAEERREEAQERAEERREELHR